MGWPTLAVKMAFNNLPLTAEASTIWTDVTAYVFSFSFRRGRQRALNRIEAGTLDMLLDNSDRRFDPTYTASPYYPDVVPMVKVRIEATWSGTTYKLFTGFVERWPPEWPGGLDATTTISAVDAFRAFSAIELNGAYASEFTNWAIDTALTAVDWPPVDRSLFAGQSQIQAGTFANTIALQHLQNIADVESGLFFIDGGNVAVFHNRHFRLTNTNSKTSAATFGDILTGAELPWMQTTKAFDDTDIYNQIRITREGGVEQSTSDVTSIDNYFLRTYRQTLPLYTDNEALALAQWLLFRYANPRFQYTSVTLSGLASDSLWPHILGREISDRITIRERPPGGSGTIEQECYIEGIRMDVSGDPQRWDCQFLLSPADALTYWVLQDSVLGKLNVTTRLAY